MRTLYSALALISLLLASPAPQDGKIVRPEDGSAFPSGEISIIATGANGKLELDATLLEAEEPFSDVFHASVSPSPGEHRITFSWEGGQDEVRIFVGENPPAEFKPFRTHPPTAVACTHCHGLSSRGRFRFEGGCFQCHQEEAFSDVHEHPRHVLEQCGLCHNAHGSMAQAHLLFPRDQACALCHTLP